MTGEDSGTNESGESVEDMEIQAMVPSSPYGPYRVRGRNDQDAGSSDTPTGVLGVTSGSGETYGVQGVTTSDGSYLSFSPSGVYGYGATSGATVGVKGVTDGEVIGAAGVRAEASDADAVALRAENAKGRAILARGGGTTPEVIEAKRNSGTAPCLKAKNTAPANTRASGIVSVIENAANDFTTAVEGLVNATSGQTYGVRGLTRSAEAEAGGVNGVATSATGQVYGVEGKVRSRTDRAAGVRGYASAGTGVTYGVLGEVDSGDGYGLYSKDDAYVDGDLEITGDLQKDTGCEVFLSQNQTFSSESLIEFDQTVIDQRNEFNTSSHEFEPNNTGDYHVETSIILSDVASGTQVEVFLYIDGEKVGKEIYQVSGAPESVTKSKTLFNVDSGSKIYVTIKPSAGVSVKGASASDQGYLFTTLTVAKIG